jgi:crossover junction endodeoxyribonuclease RusA
VSAVPAGDDAAAMWTIRLPWTKPPLSLNDRSHWRLKAKRTAAVRAETAALARLELTADRVLTGVDLTPPIDVTLTYYPRDKRRRDADNLVATLKACCDGLVDAGVVLDDDPTFMVKHMPIIAAPDGDPRLELTVREIA